MKIGEYNIISLLLKPFYKKVMGVASIKHLPRNKKEDQLYVLMESNNLGDAEVLTVATKLDSSR